MNMKTTTACSQQFRNFKGTLVSLRMASNDNAGGISIIEHQMPYGEAPPLHVHRNEDEIFHVLRGSMRFEIDGHSRVAHAGHILLAPKGVPHRFIVDSLDGAHCLTIMKGKDFETLVAEMSVAVADTSMPPKVEPSPDMIAALVTACARNAIDVIGPPLAA